MSKYFEIGDFVTISDRYLGISKIVREHSGLECAGSTGYVKIIKTDETFRLLEVISINKCCGVLGEIENCDQILVYVPIRNVYVKFDGITLNLLQAKNNV